MSPVLIGFLVLVVTLLVLATGLPIAFGLGAVALLFMVVFDGWGSDTSVKSSSPAKMVSTM